MPELSDKVGRQVHESDWVDHLARVGLVAYGVVHLVVGWLALQLAVGHDSGTTSSTGAVRELAQQPFGEVLVWLLAAGLLLLAVWQVIEAVVGHRHHQDSTRLRRRLTSAGKVLIYGYIAYSAATIAAGAGSSGGGSDSTTAKVMNLPAGQLLVGAVGAVVIGTGVYLIYKGLTGKFTDDLTAEGRSGDTGTAYIALGKAGYVAKGVSFGLVGALIGYAAATHDPQKSGGLDQALQKVLDQPFGPYLLGAIAVGLASFGIFTFAHARHLSR
jgi:Domain of Unknown Function (DUF1206)